MSAAAAADNDDNGTGARQPSPSTTPAETSPEGAPASSPATAVVHAGRHPAAQHGFVNPPVYRGSTVLFPTLDALTRLDQPYTYGRRATPTTDCLSDALCALDGGAASLLTASGLEAVTLSILAFVEAGDHVLVTDSVYQPTRRFCDGLLARLGVATTYYDPLIGSRIGALLTERTKLIFTESPGSQTFEMQDIPAIAAIAAEHDLWLVTDNTWASPLYFRPLDHGVDVAVQAATKYIVGHADAMLGVVTGTAEAVPHLKRTRDALGISVGSEEAYLGHRGLRTLAVRLARHQSSALELAAWLAAEPAVAQVLHPGLPGAPGHDLWARDFTGASGLFSIVLAPGPQSAVAAFVDHLELFGMGYSWGGYESLILPFDPRPYRTATTWTAGGPALRLHIGLEDVEDLRRDLAAGLARYDAARR
ncbi:MAG: cystathionine beta-lyase [Hyphomicrobiaceae bacterium]|nr:cystathionine beta-lyase [Hyphomicrobiaceae bacterium]